MSIFGSIVSAIFGTGHTAEAEPSHASVKSMAEIEAMIAGIAAQSKEKLDWRKSIVDLMKLLKLDSSLAARKELARELGYTGKLTATAAMNVWLHKQVMTKLAESGLQAPDRPKQ